MEAEGQEKIAWLQRLKTGKGKKLLLLAGNICLTLIGGTGMPLLVRSYFLHGAKRKWFSAFLQTAGFPVLAIPMLLSYRRRRRESDNPRPFLLTRPLLLCCAILGLITGLDDYLYSFGMCLLPVSTASLLTSLQLGFTALFAFFIVKQRFSSYTINAVVLLIFGAVLLAVQSNGELPDGEEKAKYYLGFGMTLLAAVLYAMLLPLMELTYLHARQEVTYALVVEMQFVIGFAATAFCAVGMIVNNDFNVIPREGKEYRVGEAKYYVVVVFTAVVNQLYMLGVVGIIKYASALLSGVIIAVCIPITEVLAVFLFREGFDGEKGVALALSLWGTVSYFYGEYTGLNKTKAAEKEPQLLPASAVSRQSK